MQPNTVSPLRRELNALVRLAAPVVFVQLGIMAMGTVDTAMLGRFSGQALAAGALGNSVAFGLQIFCMGLLMALDPLIAQAHGGGDAVRLSRHLQRGVVLALALAVPLSLVMWDLEWLLRLLGQDPVLWEPTTTYMKTLVWANPALLLFVVFRQSLQAMSRLREAAIAILVANVFNAFANWLLIFGNAGAPRLGVAGSAWATAISRTVMVATLLALAWPTLRPFLASFRRAILRPAGYAQMLRLGVPIAFHMSVELWLFSAAALLIGRIGAQALAAHQIALSLAAISFMVPMGIAGAAATRVGNAIGRGDREGARRSAKLSIGLGAAVMIVSAAAFALLPAPLARLFTPDESIVALAVVLLPIAALFQVFDGLQVVSSGVLRGAADTRVPALLAIVGYWFLGLPLGAYLGLSAGLGAAGLWWGLTAGLAGTALLLLARLRVVMRGELQAVAIDLEPLDEPAELSR